MVSPPVTLGQGFWVADIRYGGQRNFIVWARPVDGSSPDLLVNVIGSYQGSRPIEGGRDYRFEVTASASWSISLTSLAGDPGAATFFSGRGDAVSGAFSPWGARPHGFTHDGTRNFIVWLRCSDGRDDLAVNEIGPVNQSSFVDSSTAAAYCFWDVRADGNWTIRASP